MNKICMMEDIPEREARAFETVNGGTIFITQRDGCFYAYQNLCPHLQVELEFLEISFWIGIKNTLSVQHTVHCSRLKRVTASLDLVWANPLKRSQSPCILTVEFI